MNKKFTLEGNRIHSHHYDPNAFRADPIFSNPYNDMNIYACQSQNQAKREPELHRRSSIAYFADETPTKIDLSFDSNEIFRLENVLGMDGHNNNRNNNRNCKSRRAHPHVHDHTKRNSTFPSTNLSFHNIFPFSNNIKNVRPVASVVSDGEWEGEDESRLAESVKSASTSLQPFFNNFTPPLTSFDVQQQQQQQYNQYPKPSTTPSITMENNTRKRKEMELPLPKPPSKVRFRSHQAESWMEKYGELLDFRLYNRHCLVPNQFPQNPPLAEWVKRQRYQYKLKGLGKHSSMTDDRVIALEKLGFVWNSHDAVWEERLKELKKYKSIYSNTNVPSKYEQNPQLAIWVKRQRRQYKFLAGGKQSTMTPYRVEKLREIDFSWSGRKSKTFT
eukprot:CAMPEP_0168303260 /NCGR_PEP_ID=MMETSP0142_2-20121227/42100_1 /TAXON_ID=44445 /ORGANISM="Pseudo-nitzschia australis, Strain 10249 10 AB" /LENGTH=387 /DNA_ID=CAMNT_0008254103 /DNA_START=208 /DNA_END=1371 /DNA_ORIENTATION=+